ncbi:MAG: DUF1588 domain-containing protein [Bdellovibrionales bacterium]|nr:DUF1588 domain-containing protein [Bdellovibrionales bacterium]
MNTSRILAATVSIILTLSPPDARASESTTLSDAARLRKLSLSVRGTLPATEDFKELEAAQKAGTSEEFFRSKARAYSRSEYAFERLTYRLRALFRLRHSEYLGDQQMKLILAYREGKLKNEGYTKLITIGEDQGIVVPSVDEIRFTEKDTANTLFLDVARGAKSWDAIFNSRSFRFAAGLYTSEENFFAAVNPLIPVGTTSILRRNKDFLYNGSRESSSYGKQLREFVFHPNDPRFAGIFTTPRFTGRFSTTFLNQNRGRASQLFRTGLCDSMTPVVVVDNAQTEEVLALAKPKAESSNNDLVNNAHAAIEKKHGSDPQCVACHYKLDPAGKTFQNNTIAASVSASPGALVYKDQSGNLIHLNARGIGDLADHMVKRPEYAQCQVTHLWNWYIGTDFPLTESVLNELVTTFDQVGRKAPEMVQYLVSRPEFRQIQVKSAVDQDPLMIARTEVKDILKQCSDCHDNVGNPVPRFHEFPLSENPEEHRSWVQKIAKATQVDDAGNSYMPPDWSGWKPSAQERKKIENWIQQELSR